MRTPNRPIRAAIVGTGMIAVNHAKSLRAIEGVTLAAVCDVDLSRAEAFAEKHVAEQAFGSLDAMLNESLDLITVCTPHPVHESVVVAAAERGVHVLCEKPVAVALDAVDRMLEATERSGVRFGVVLQRRLWPAAQRLRRAIDEGRFGEPIAGTLNIRLGRDAEYFSDPWRGRWDTEGGGVLMNQGTHYIDLLQWYMGRAVRVQGAIRTAKHADYIEVEDTASAVVEFASGAVATIQAGTTFAPGLGTTVFVTDRAGQSASIAEYPEGVPATNDIWTVAGEEEYRPFLSVAVEADPPMPQIHAGLAPFHTGVIEDFVDAVRNERDPLVTGRDARHSLEIILAIYESSRTGRAVDLASVG